MRNENLKLYAITCNEFQKRTASLPSTYTPSSMVIMNITPNDEFTYFGNTNSNPNNMETLG